MSCSHCLVLVIHLHLVFVVVADFDGLFKSQRSHGSSFFSDDLHTAGKRELLTQSNCYVNGFSRRKVSTHQRFLARQSYWSNLFLTYDFKNHVFSISVHSARACMKLFLDVIY